MTDVTDPHAIAPEPKSPARKNGWRLRTRWSAPVRAHHVAQAQPKRTLTATLREWHKRAGLGAFLFMGWLGVSGVALNQSASWGLDAMRVDWRWLMTVYGLHAQSPETGFSADGHWLAVQGEHAVMDGRLLNFAVKPPLGLAAGGAAGHRCLLLASYDGVLLLSPGGERIDELQAGLTLPVKAIARIGVSQDTAGLAVIEDQKLYGSSDGENWKPLPASTRVNWSQSFPLSHEQRGQFENFARPSVAAEQVLIDLHSGRLFGRLGPWVINAVGIAALWLAISGVWMMWRTSQARRRNVARR